MERFIQLDGKLIDLKDNLGTKIMGKLFFNSHLIKFYKVEIDEKNKKRSKQIKKRLKE